MVTKSTLDIQGKKYRFTIKRNLSGISVVDRPPNDTKTNRAYFVTNGFVLLEQAIFARGRAPHEKRVVVHGHNCSIHASRVSTDWLKEHNIFFIPHPPYSLDLAPSYFCLFPTVKEKLERIRLAEEDQFFFCLQEVLRGIHQKELDTIFRA
jgi:hypothetical protein